MSGCVTDVGELISVCSRVEAVTEGYEGYEAVTFGYWDSGDVELAGCSCGVGCGCFEVGGEGEGDEGVYEMYGTDFLVGGWIRCADCDLSGD